MRRKTGIIIFLLLLMTHSACRAGIQPPQGPDQKGALPAVVLSETLTLRADREETSEALKTLCYGDWVAVTESWDGWAACQVNASGRKGWIPSDFLAVDPSMYLAEEPMHVFAWNGILSPKVAVLAAGEGYPILREDEEWLMLGLRGGAGWIVKTAKDRTPADQLEWVRNMGEIQRAVLKTSKGSVTLLSPEGLRWIRENFSIAQPMVSAGCPFDAQLTLYFEDGTQRTLDIAIDSCRNFRTEDGAVFAYGDGEKLLRETGSTSGIGEAFWALFGMKSNDLIP